VHLAFQSNLPPFPTISDHSILPPIIFEFSPTWSLHVSCELLLFRYFQSNFIHFPRSKQYISLSSLCNCYLIPIFCPVHNPKHPSSCEFSCIVFSTSFHFMGMGYQFKAQPQTLRTIVSVFVWNLTRHLSSLGDPANSYITTGISLENIGWHKSHHHGKAETTSGGFELVKYCYLLFLHHWHNISHHPAI
jgi:hypothetical protein